jgi:hypothetical protein
MVKRIYTWATGQPLRVVLPDIFIDRLFELQSKIKKFKKELNRVESISIRVSLIKYITNEFDKHDTGAYVRVCTDSMDFLIPNYDGDDDLLDYTYSKLKDLPEVFFTDYFLYHFSNEVIVKDDRERGMNVILRKDIGLLIRTLVSKEL